MGKLLSRPDERVNAKGSCTGVYIWSNYEKDMVIMSSMHHQSKVTKHLPGDNYKLLKLQGFNQ